MKNKKDRIKLIFSPLITKFRRKRRGLPRRLCLGARPGQRQNDYVDDHHDARDEVGCGTHSR